jgi:thermitase
VAGAAGAQSDNGQGIASVAGQSPIMPIRVTNNSGRATSATIANGLVWATDHGASVMNVSFEGIAGNTTIRTAAEYAFNHGALVVAASGNCGCVDSTADNPFVLSVSATDESDSIAYFSSTGPYVDLSAPGTNILTTAIGGLYLSDSGTSLASPIVAGVAALMFSANPALTPTVVTELLESTALDAGGAGYDPGFGYGRVNAYAAVTAAASYVPPPDATPPTASITAPGAGATVSGTVVVGVSATDNVGVVQVDLFVDGVFFASDASAPYSFAWDTTTASSGSHTLQAVAADAAGNSGSTAAITVTVSNVNQAPVAVNDAFTVPYRAGNSYAPQVFTVLANDRDPDGALNVGSVRVVNAPNKGGTVTVNANGTVSYTPKKNYRGTENFTYNVKDNLGAISNTATVTVTVQ